MNTSAPELPVRPDTQTASFQVTPPIPFKRLEKTIIDPLMPGVKHTFTLGYYPVASQADAMYLTEKTAELVARYVSEDEKGNVKAVMTSGGGRVPISQTLCMYVATLMLAEYSCMSVANRTADDWFRFSVEVPNAWRELLTWWYAETRQKAEEGAADGKPLPNACAG